MTQSPGTGSRAGFTWNALLWSLIYPRRAHRIMPTVPGLVLIALALGIGMAAYNSSSNILFLTLALLLTCLILGGVLSWLNFRRVTWELQPPASLRAGHDAIVGLRLANAKRSLPTYGLWFNFLARPSRPPAEQRAESTFTARGAEVRAVLAQADAAEIRGRAVLSSRLDPGGETRLEWIVRPAQRGVLTLELLSVGSLFPFGFLRKDIGMALSTQAVVWPAPIEYRRHAPMSARRQTGLKSAARAGSGDDLMAVRRYTTGDSHRLIHWKASARTGQLLVRQFAAEVAEGYSLWLRTDAGLWTRAEQFEVLVRFAATLAEDLFRAGQLQTVAVNDEPPTRVRRVRDMEEFLDQLALVQPRQTAMAGRTGMSEVNTLTFAPEGARGVCAWVNGQVAAVA